MTERVCLRCPEMSKLRSQCGWVACKSVCVYVCVAIEIF